MGDTLVRQRYIGDPLVEDIIVNTPASNPYQSLKQMLVKRFSQFTEANIIRHLDNERARAYLVIQRELLIVDQLGEMADKLYEVYHANNQPSAVTSNSSKLDEKMEMVLRTEGAVNQEGEPTTGAEVRIEGGIRPTWRRGSITTTRSLGTKRGSVKMAVSS